MFPDSSAKRAYTYHLFTRIAPRYEWMNQVLSLGRVNSWRRAAAVEARLSSDGWALDVATGEGGMARALLQRWPGAKVVGLDFSRKMLQMGQAHSTGWPIRWMEGDALSLPFPSNVFEAVVSAFMLRNVTDVQAALTEQVRVVRIGGRVICLEMTWPRSPFFRPLFHLYFGGIVPVLGWLFTGDLDAYRYLPRSVQAFVSPEELAAMMEAAGLQEVHYRRLMMGTITLHVGVKASGEATAQTRGACGACVPNGPSSPAPAAPRSGPRRRGLWLLSRPGPGPIPGR